MTVKLLIIYGIFATVLLCLSIFFNIKFAKSIFKIQDSVEESIDVLDQTYGAVTKILERPVFFDSIEVRQVINEINQARQSILYVANVLGEVEDVDISNEEAVL